MLIVPSAIIIGATSILAIDILWFKTKNLEPTITYILSWILMMLILWLTTEICFGI